jgi:hypothetical protein
MSKTGEAKDACASRAKPRLEERVCERGRRPTLDRDPSASITRRALERARRLAIAHAADTPTDQMRLPSMEAAA